MTAASATYTDLDLRFVAENWDHSKELISILNYQTHNHISNGKVDLHISSYRLTEGNLNLFTKGTPIAFG